MTGYFSCDASMDQKTKVYTISAVNLRTGEPLFQKTGRAKNILEAEEEAIYETLRKGRRFGEHIIIFSDNRKAVENARVKAVQKSKFFKIAYKYVQIVWIERGDNFIADFFSKHVDGEIARQNAIKKMEAEIDRVFHVNDIFFPESKQERFLKEGLSRMAKESGLNLQTVSKKHPTPEDIKKDILAAKIEKNQMAEKYLLALLAIEEEKRNSKER